MISPIKTVQRSWDNTNERLMANARANVEVTAYVLQQNGAVVCQMWLRNGMIIEGFALRAGGSDGRMRARLQAARQVMLIEQYLEAERLVRETADGKTEGTN